mmetsp:Transcript_58552/g.171309  ORF Transcript_58552/g.171309 Transcript_58552/m.171309 type:complete len:208 (-) Transcript_58552:1071-1694(-)
MAKSVRMQASSMASFSRSIVSWRSARSTCSNSSRSSCICSCAAGDMARRVSRSLSRPASWPSRSPARPAEPPRAGAGGSCSPAEGWHGFKVSMGSSEGRDALELVLLALLDLLFSFATPLATVSLLLTISKTFRSFFQLSLLVGLIMSCWALLSSMIRASLSISNSSYAFWNLAPTMATGNEIRMMPEIMARPATRRPGAVRGTMSP